MRAAGTHGPDAMFVSVQSGPQKCCLGVPVALAQTALYTDMQQVVVGEELGGT